ncbi:MAG TPA: diguanylate cyclase [Steroidobacteraceae bacterium]|nr:diguanylate cyclase [Steroidobacteraceae bacterium]
MDPLATQQLIITGQSATQRQLEAGFPWLKFEHELEREFRREQARTRLLQIRFNLYLGAVLVVAFGCLNHLVLGPGSHTLLDLVQFGLLLPIFAGGIAITYLTSGRRIYPRLAPVFAPMMGLIVVAVELKAAQAGAQIVFAMVLLTSVYLYYLIGLLFYDSLRANVIMWCAFLAFGIVGGVAEADVIYDAVVLLLGNIVGATVAYNLELEMRTHFLERRMLSETAARDGLTGIYNRRRFDEHLQTLWMQALREGATLALVMVDIDFFKRFNDRQGHQAGDECLKAVAAALARAARRPLDLVARFGGEEFAVLLYDPSRQYLHDVANRIHGNVAALRIPHGDSSVGSVVTVSAGIAYVAPTLERSTQGFVQLADEALYQAKSDGRNTSVFDESAYESLQTGAFRAARTATAV